MTITSATLKLIKEAEDKLMASYRKTSSQRTKVADLRKQLKSAEDKLTEQTVAESKIISNKAYSTINSLLTDNKFLKDLKDKADFAYKKAKRKRKKSSTDVAKLTKDMKIEAVDKAFKARKYADLKSRELKDELIKLGVMSDSSNLTQWFASLKLPKAASKSLGSPKEGKLYIHKSMPW